MDKIYNKNEIGTSIKLTRLEKLPMAYQQAYEQGMKYFNNPASIDIELKSITITDIKEYVVANFKLTGERK